MNAKVGGGGGGGLNTTITLRHGRQYISFPSNQIMLYKLEYYSKFEEELYCSKM